MDKQKLNSLLTDPNSLNHEDYNSLIELKKEHPYVQAFYPLIAIGAKKFDTSNYKHQVQSAAIYTFDRVLLKKMVSSADAQQEKQQAHAKKVLIKNKEKENFKEKAQPEVKSAEIEPKELNKDHLPDSFFKELYSEMDALKKSKEAYNDFISKLEDSSKARETKKADSSPAKSKVKKKSTKAVKSSPSSTKSVSKKHAVKKEVKDTPTKKTVVKKPTKKSLKKSLLDGDHQSILDEIELKQVKAIEDEHLKEQIDLITNFIEKEPSINKKMLNHNVDAKRVIEDLSESSTHLSDDVISETLAKLMVNQGRKEKAIDIYKKLIWKFPQKKTYFAEQIKKLKKEE